MTSTMSTTNKQPCGVHLVGSMPLLTSSQAFERAVSALPGRLQRIPDGEPGKRYNWIGFQAGVLAQSLHPLMRGQEAGLSEQQVQTLLTSSPPLATEYDDFALSSYATFCELRAAGTIPRGTRFQVCLPTGLSAVAMFVDSAYRKAVEPFYEKALLSALRRIQEGIPADDLAIQLDIAIEFALLENADSILPGFVPWFSPLKEGMLERIVRITSEVDSAVELGFHLCYGDLGHKHFVEPEDMRKLVDMANGIQEEVAHPIAWIHMPVPKNRTDSAYFAPLKSLKLKENTHLFLGVVHFADEAGTEQRIRAAQAVVERFGVATECGMGRTPEAELDSIFQICRAVSEPY